MRNNQTNTDRQRQTLEYAVLGLRNSKPLVTPHGYAPLPREWCWSRLDDVCEGIFDCPHSTPQLTSEGPYLVRSQDMRSGTFRVEEAARVSEDTYAKRISRAQPRHGDLLYSREGTYFGIAAEVPRDVRVCLGQRMVLLRPDDEKASFRYLRYWLNSPAMACHVHGHRDGTVAERLNMPTIEALPVRLPPLPEQKAIAHILGTLDDKIELNRRMNQTLEAIAQALFKEWFIDAVRNGERKGWSKSTIGGLCTFEYGKPLKEEDRSPGPVPVYGSGGQVGWHTEALVKGPGIVVGRKGNPGAVTWAPVDFYPIDTTFYVLPTKECHSLLFLFHALRHAQLASLSADSAVPGLNRKIAYATEQPVPPPHLQLRLEQQARPLFAQIRHKEEESRTLAQLRDTLLPKLLSGELRIKDAETFLEART